MSFNILEILEEVLDRCPQWYEVANLVDLIADPDTDLIRNDGRNIFYNGKRLQRYTSESQYFFLAQQLLQVQLSGGNFIKNIFSFFVILVMIMMLISGEWRRHVFIIAYTVGYHMVLVLSNFAHSGRFHMPVWPMLMLFAAYGIQIAKTNAKVRKWFPIVLVLEVLVCLAWNWFKFKGRGMI